ncbi:16S rRNA (guanine(527)-N(7))-methyltransferase RsmG [Prosthecomicrobium sp. N25]|uniref:16S rRNA (guanine(527)-N(7))-methyltransferase RsmG n=1 Tax=Prosthecomicrobium sp. N25 TaxID=3129254 RepID=UPI0030784445
MPSRLPETPDSLDAVLTVSRETKERLSVYVELVRKWQRSQNLIAPGTVERIWTRHVADSAQALAALPEARRWADLGSGAGFPGLVTAICLAGAPGAHVHLVESNRGKASFLRTVIRETGAPASVHAERIEGFTATFAEPVDAVSARALAPLADLCRLAEPLSRRGAALVFHKGQDFASELAEATQSWVLDLVEHPSRIDPGGRIVVIRSLRPR